MLHLLGAGYGTKRRSSSVRSTSALWGILLQKSKVAGLGIFRENTTRKPIADSCALNRVAEVACAFSVKR